MNERIRDLAITGGIYDCICDPYDQQKNGDQHSSVLPDLERFAEKIVRECVQVSLKSSHRNDDMGAIIARNIQQHFGVNYV